MTQPKSNGHAGRSNSENGPTGRPFGPEAELTDQELSPEALAEIWARRAYELAKPPPAEATGHTLHLLLFVLDNEQYAVEVSYVREVYQLEQLTPIPRTPNFVVGIFSARGRLISVVDLRAFFGLSPTNLSPESKVVSVGLDDGSGMEIGILSDEVTDVITVFEEDLDPALTSQVGNRVQFTRGIAPGMIVVLDMEALLKDKQLIVNEEIL